MVTIFLTIGILGVAVALLSLRVLLVRDGEFRGACGSNNPYLRNNVGECRACGKSEDQDCEYVESRAPAVSAVLDRIAGR